MKTLNSTPRADGAFAIDMDRAAFQHEAFGVVALAPLHFQHLGRQFLIAVTTPTTPVATPPTRC